MSAMSSRALTGSECALSGRVAGAVFAETRRQLGRTQEGLAEYLEVAPNTVQGWESGRKPLINLPFGRLRQLRRALSATGARTELLQLMDSALCVDSILTEINTLEPARHPLGLTVPDRTTTELLEWPISGKQPRALRGTNAMLSVGHGVQDSVAAGLQKIAERAGYGSAHSAMIRRQAKYLVASNPASVGWARHQEREDAQRVCDLREWSPEWPVARSAAVSAAFDSDLEPLRRFISEGLSGERTMAANLNYWAYWVGEIGATWDSDVAMVHANSSWTGQRLLASLVDGIVTAPYRELCTVTLWALLRARRQFAVHPYWQPRIMAAVGRALDTSSLAGQARQRLEQVRYLVEGD